MTPEEVHAATVAYVETGERAGWGRVLEALRTGELVLTSTPDGILISRPECVRREP